MPVTQIIDNDGHRLEINADGSIGTNHSITSAVIVTPSDTADLAAGPTKGIYVGGAGNVVAILADGTTATFIALTVGVVHPISVKRVKATSTTATPILALY